MKPKTRTTANAHPIPPKSGLASFMPFRCLPETARH
jgi:hypothetical protein